ncbi:hypothetical protein BOTBODRAFT_437969 [Botryobasidium botryosum FD-172 SS1]|uniref:Zn(2)-C6 fungal-type domain-containing protein n=1 Tax=Botryobasidium botryosum (strain FD-172 SS1) TaxID=930990 RepID=A0A067N6K4_BOTB1|nr:hypothetical protein BOTBODRAFT_437969 [Botryobasidium botryosum FD-172 SS1]
MPTSLNLDTGSLPPFPPLKGKRIKKGTACTACRTKKRRCDGAKPRCTLCVHDDEPECTHTVMKVTPRTLVLQRRVADLEAQILSLQAALDATNIGSGSVVQQASHSTSAHRAGLVEVLNRNYDLPSSEKYIRNIHQELRLAQGRIPPLLGSWWSTNESPPSGLITHLVELFVEEEHQHTHDPPRSPEFYASLHDPSPDIGPHPALRNAMFLVACDSHPGPLTSLEPIFLRRTTNYLNLALARVDRLLDFIEAYTLLAIYYMFKGRSLQGAHSSAAIMTFAVACGLHAVRPPEWHPIDSPALLPHTFCRTELRRRIKVWWMAFTTNRLCSSAINKNRDIEDEKIETVWDMPLESSDLQHQQIYRSTVSSLFIRNSSATYVHNDTSNVIRSKCIAMIDYATRIGLMAVSSMTRR